MTDYMDVRETVYARAGGKCEICGESVGYLSFQLAHRIPATKNNLKKYGKRAIHHPINLMCTCCLKCNDAALVGQNWEEERRILKEITNDINKQYNY